jgi:hypothetical protein
MSKRYSRAGVWKSGFGPLLAEFPLRAVRAVRQRKSRALPVRLPVVDIELAEGSTLDLELLAIDRPKDFIAALETARAGAKRAVRAWP